MAPLVEQVQDETGDTVELAYADQSYTSYEAAQATDAEGMELVVEKKAKGQQGFIVLPKR